jgi:hypothetical protein
LPFHFPFLAVEPQPPNLRGSFFFEEHMMRISPQTQRKIIH